MKKIVCLILICIFFVPMANAEKVYSIKALNKMGIVANEQLSKTDLENAKSILTNIHKKTVINVENGSGPFYAEVYDSDGNFVAGAANSVVNDKNCTRHAEMNTLDLVHKIYGKYDLSNENLTIYINAEPCVMCMGGIMWSGIKRIFYSVPSREVEKITGFDEGYKPAWQDEFRKRGILVYGNICSDNGCIVLKQYVADNRKIYRPQR